MEHLHHGPRTVDMQFPYLSNTNFDYSGEWEKYPGSEGIPIEKIRNRRWREFEPNLLSKVLQNWLFFALLRAILPAEVTLQVEDFIRVDSKGMRFITTDRLPNYFSEWSKALERLSADERDQKARMNERVLEQANLLAATLSMYPERGFLQYQLHLPLPLEVALSCALLGDALAFTNGSLANRKPHLWFPGKELWAELMESDGWCPFITSGAVLACGLSNMHYYATLGGPAVKLSHRRCTEKFCIHTRKIDARHCNPECRCLTLKPDVEELVEVIRRQEIPVLRYRRDREQLEIGAAGEAVPYVCISHVWSDGLGNPKGNEMNTCQLDRVQQAVNRLYFNDSSESQAPVWWWLDTLCVPKGEYYRSEEQETIAQMKAIYTQAKKVLIFDSGLSACSDPTDILEILARFRLSNWIRRLWTIQEGVFASSIYLVVGSTPISLLSLVQQVHKLPVENFQRQIGAGLINNYSHIFGPAVYQVTTDKTEIVPTALVAGQLTESRMVGVLVEVSTRTSTFQSDEAVCLALLLDISPVPITKEIKAEKEREDSKGNETREVALKPSKAGMTKFFQLADEASKDLDPPGCIPPTIISWPAKRLTEPGFRWAPESFLGVVIVAPKDSLVIPDLDNPGQEMTRPSGTLCKDGLRVMYPGIEITEISTDQPIFAAFNIDTRPDKGRKPYMPPYWNVSYLKAEFDPVWERDIAPTAKDSGKLAIIICENMDLKSSGLFCVLVRIKRRDAGELIVERLGTMSGSRTSSDNGLEQAREPWKRVKGKWLPMNQIWCVD